MSDDDNTEGENLNPSFHDLINNPDMAGPINHENQLNPSLEDLGYNVNINPPIGAGTSKNDSNPPKNEVHTISDNSSERKIKTKYFALRTISVFLKILAIIVVIGGLASSYQVYRDTSSVLTTIAVIIGALVACVVIWAHAELIILFIDIEANTRSTEINTKHKNP
jgi:phage shock protein PspC (stress-responsive transcriptional regulator)